MAYDKEGTYFAFFGSEWDGLMKVLVVWECLTSVMLIALCIYLNLTIARIPQQILRKLQAFNFLAIVGMSAIIVVHLDNAPPILSWLIEFVSFIQIVLSVILATDFFKKFSVLGNHFTVDSVVRFQYYWIALYITSVGSAQFGYLVNLGHVCAPFLYSVLFVLI